MTHSEPSAIAAIAQQSTLSRKMPYVFAGMIKLYDGTELPYSKQIISPSLESNRSLYDLGRGKCETPSTLLSITLKRTCDILFRQVWKLKLNIKMENLKVEESMIEDAMREWIDSSINLTLRSKLLSKVFYHEFDFNRDTDRNEETDNDNSNVDAYFLIWRVLFKILYHPNMKTFILPDVKSIIIDRMYLKMQKHLEYNLKNPEEPLPPFKYQDQLQEIMFMGHKQEYLLRKLLEHVTSGKHIHKEQLLMEKVKLGLDSSQESTFSDIDNSNTLLHDSNEPLAFKKLLSKLNHVKHMEIENGLNDNDLYTIGTSCSQLVGLSVTSSGISNFGIHNLAFTNLSCPYIQTIFDLTKSHDFVCTCKKQNMDSDASRSLRKLNIKGLINVDHIGVLIALRAFKSLNWLESKNESVCMAIEHVSRLQEEENVDWNSDAIKVLECGLKQTLLFSIFKHTNDMVLLYLLSKFVPKIEQLTYHFNDFVNMIRYQRPRPDLSDLSRQMDTSIIWSTFSNLSTLYLTNVIGSEIMLILKSIGTHLLDLSISNISLWSYFDTLYPTQRFIESPNNTLFNEDVRMNLFELAMTAPNLNKLSLEMCHFFFNDNDTQNATTVDTRDEQVDNITAKRQNTNLDFLPNLRELHVKGVNSKSSEALKIFLCHCYNLEELILLTKQYTTGNYNLRFNAADEYEFCHIINENALLDILKRNPMKFLKVFIASTVEPCPSGCTLQLTEKSLKSLLDICDSLERIGNLDRWNIPNLETVLTEIKTNYKWRTCPVYFCSKIEHPSTI